MLLHPKQANVLKDKHRFRVLNWGRRAGKTSLAIEEIKSRALASTQVIAYTAPTYQQARDIAWEELKKQVTPIIHKVNESRLEVGVKNLKGEISTIKLRGWESIESLRGQAFDFLVPDEVAMCRNFWVGWNEVLRATLTDRRGDAMFISTPKGYNHFYDLYMMFEKDDDWASFHATSYDNPHIPRDEIDKAKKELPEDVFAQEYMADFRKTEGLVYKEFDRNRHCIEDDPKDIKEVRVGVDFGWRNPSGILRILVDKDDNYYCVEEIYKPNLDVNQIKTYVGQMKPNKVYADPENPEKCDALNNEFNIIPVSKSVEAGIDYVRSLFKQNRLFVHKRCKNLIAELESYRYEEQKVDKNAPEKPVKHNDHLVDGLRYSLFSDQPSDTKPFIQKDMEMASDYYD